MSITLKPCPHCGGEAVFQHYHTADDGAPFWFVRCMGCGTGSWYYNTEGEAAEAWNRRDNLARKLLRKLKACVSRLAREASE